MREILKRHKNLLFAALVGLCMSGFMSFALTAINFGFGSDFFAKWLQGFGLSFLIALPVALLIVPAIRRLVDKIAAE